MKRFTLMLVSAASAWCGTMNLPLVPTISCAVMSMPSQTLVADNCRSIPGIGSDIHFDGYGIHVRWGQDGLDADFATGYTLRVMNMTGDPSLVARGSIYGFVGIEQDFVATGMTGIGYVSETTGWFGDHDGVDGGVRITAGPGDGSGRVPFTFGVPFHLSAFAAVNRSVMAPYLSWEEKGAGLSSAVGLRFSDAQGGRLTGFDVEPVPTVTNPEPSTWVLLLVGAIVRGIIYITTTERTSD